MTTPSKGSALSACCGKPVEDLGVNLPIPDTREIHAHRCSACLKTCNILYPRNDDEKYCCSHEHALCPFCEEPPRSLSLTPSQIQRANRAQWIERALDGIERFSNSSLTTNQKNAISIQFGVLMDQLEVATNALQSISGGHEESTYVDSKGATMDTYIAREALEQLKSSPK